MTVLANTVTRDGPARSAPFARMLRADTSGVLTESSLDAESLLTVGAVVQAN